MHKPYIQPHLYSDGSQDWIQVDDGNGGYLRFQIDHIGLFELASATTRRLRLLHAKSSYGLVSEPKRQ
jgi:hypothetical protein